MAKTQMTHARTHTPTQTHGYALMRPTNKRKTIREIKNNNFNSIFFNTSFLGVHFSVVETIRKQHTQNSRDLCVCLRRRRRRRCRCRRRRRR